MLALALGKSLHEIDRLTPAELASWREHYVLYPFDDHHRFFRPAAVICGSVPQLRDPQRFIEDRLAWLSPSYAGPSVEFGDADMNTIKALGGVPPKQFAKE